MGRTMKQRTGHGCGGRLTLQRGEQDRREITITKRPGSGGDPRTGPQLWNRSQIVSNVAHYVEYVYRQSIFITSPALTHVGPDASSGQPSKARQGAWRSAVPGLDERVAQLDTYFWLLVFRSA